MTLCQFLPRGASEDTSRNGRGRLTLMSSSIPAPCRCRLVSFTTYVGLGRSLVVRARCSVTLAPRESYQEVPPRSYHMLFIIAISAPLSSCLSGISVGFMCLNVSNIYVSKPLANQSRFHVLIAAALGSLLTRPLRVGLHSLSCLRP